RKEAKQIAQNKKEDWNEIEVRSISKILVAAEIESYKIICSIESVDTYWGWFYIGCKFVTDTADVLLNLLGMVWESQFFIVTYVIQ
ncbi:unnamed protein product, partial [Brassica oleracea var. botrytis]